MKTRQEIFEKMLKGLKAQGWIRSMGRGGACLYYGEEGRRCAVGHLLPKAGKKADLVRRKHNFEHVTGLISLGFLNQYKDEKELIYSVQKWHDTDMYTETSAFLTTGSTSASLSGNATLGNLAVDALKIVAEDWQVTVPEWVQ